MKDNALKWYFISTALIFIVMFISIALESKYDKEIVVACYEAGKLDCDKIKN